MSNFEVVIPPGLQGVYDAWHFAPATIANGMVYCSGIIGTSPDGEPLKASTGAADAAFDAAQQTLQADDAALSDMLAIRDPQAQFDAAFGAVRAVLQAAGTGMGNIVNMTTYHINIGTHMAVFMAVKDRHITAPWPAWTAIGVSELIIPGGLMEISVVAALK
jgi:enamine deaminase RidA (YjgF/YER057c/UK114 family)